MDTNEFLLYGANGYTGDLIARLASEYGLRPILAGRKEDALKRLAQELQLTYQVVDLADTNKLQNVVSGVQAVLNAAGPFVNTFKPVAEACLQTGRHYIDITGEIEVFELAKQFGERSKAAGIMVMPGVGFDVVPTDCLALFLKNHLPNATHLELAFFTLNGGLSHGTATTMIQHLGEGGAVRTNGVLKKEPIGYRGMSVDFGPTQQFVISIPWGDLSTAYHTTGIANIQTYTGVPAAIYNLLKFQNSFNWLLRKKFFRNYVNAKVDRRPVGPTTEERRKAKSLVWGRAKNSTGNVVQARLSAPEAYTFTAHSSLLVLKKIIAGIWKPGYHTPAEVYGPDLVLEIPGVKREIII